MQIKFKNLKYLQASICDKFHDGESIYGTSRLDLPVRYTRFQNENYVLDHRTAMAK